MVTWSEQAIVETFQSIFSTRVKLRDVQIELNPLKGQHHTGVLAFGQSNLEGVLAVSFPLATLLSLASHVYNIEPKRLSDEQKVGVVSEVASIVFALLKEKYNQLGAQYQAGFPIIVVGEQHLIFSTFPTNKMHLGFDSAHGSFTFEIAAAQGK